MTQPFISEILGLLLNGSPCDEAGDWRLRETIRPSTSVSDSVTKV
jgi:hypothetical protein